MRIRTRLLLGGTGVLALAAVVTVAIHLAPVRALLGWQPLGASGSRSMFCPLGHGEQPARTAAVAIPATPRPALGFTLDVTTRAQVAAWASAHAIECVERRGALACADVPGGALGDRENALAATSMWFRFSGDRLAAVQTVRRSARADDVVAAFGAAESSMTKRVGDPAARTGIADASLSAGALRQAMVEYRAPAYRAVVRATNMGDGYVLTESYAN